MATSRRKCYTGQLHPAELGSKAKECHSKDHRGRRHLQGQGSSRCHLPHCTENACTHRGTFAPPETIVWHYWNTAFCVQLHGPPERRAKEGRSKFRWSQWPQEVQRAWKPISCPPPILTIRVRFIINPFIKSLCEKTIPHKTQPKWTGNFAVSDLK